MYYSNMEIFDKAETAFYEVFRRHNDKDRGGTYTSDFVLGTVDSICNAEDICFDLQAKSDLLITLSKGYTPVWEDFEDIHPYTKQPRQGRRSTGKWLDEFGYIEALEEFRKIDPTYYSRGQPEYLYRAVRRLPKLNSSI